METITRLARMPRFLNRKRLYYFSRVKIWLAYCFLFMLCATFLRKRKRPFSRAAVKRALLIRNDKIGDMIVTTPLIRNLHAAGWEISVVSFQTGLDVLASNPCVAERIPFDGEAWKDWFRSLRNVRKKHYDIALDLRRYGDARHLLFASLARAAFLAGLSKQRLGSFNISIPYTKRFQHVTGEFKAILDSLGIEADDFHYDLPVDAASEEAGRRLAQSLTDGGKQRLVLFNPFGRDAFKHFPDDFVAAVLPMLREMFPEAKVAAIGRPVDLDTLPCLGRDDRAETSSMAAAVSLVRHADLLVSVDTSLVHVASAFQKPSVCVYIRRPHETEIARDGSYQQLRDVLDCRLLDCEELTKSRFVDGADSKVYSEVDSVWDIKDTWAPNNPNAVQLYFEGKTVAHLDRDGLVAAMRDACRRFQPLTGGVVDRNG